MIAHNAPALVVIAPILLVVAGLIAAPLLDLRRTPGRALVAAGAALIVGRYLLWRLGETIPWDAAPAALGFALACLAIELFGLFDAVLLYAFLVRRTDRSAEADRGEAALRATPVAAWPEIDVIIATYNEPLEVLEKTIVGALALNWPRMNLWVADDGRRPWLMEFARAKGAGYLTRPDNEDAKAGNINHALSVTSAPFVAVFDADFVPQREFLMRTMGLFEDERVGIVQVPHSFYNHDPMQQNLALRGALPDDQRFFFEAIMPGRDGWDAAFCCGSNSVTRRTALARIGGRLPSGSITEDMLLTLCLLRHGYVTRYLCEPLAYGLAPESLSAFFVQRARWARGAMQILFLKDGPLGPGLRLRQRLFFLPTAWLSQCLMLLMSVIAPLVFLFLDVPPLVNVTPETVLFQLIPAVMAQIGGIVLLGGGRYMPLAQQVLGTFQSFRLLPVIIGTLLRPHGHAFTVTPKGSDATGAEQERPIFLVSGLLMFATLAGLVINAIPETRVVAEGALVPIVALWGLLNIIVLFLVCMVCLGRPSPRADQRFGFDERLAVRRDGRPPLITRGIDLSLAGAAVVAHDLEIGEAVTLDLPGIGLVRGRVARIAAGVAGVAFAAHDDTLRDELIRRLFTSGRAGSVRYMHPLRAMATMISRIWTIDTPVGALPGAAPPARPAAARLPARSLVVWPERGRDSSERIGI